MSETIQAALITLISASLGAVVGALSSFFAAKYAAKGQLQQIIVRENYSSRLSAYQALLSAHDDLLNSNYSEESAKAFVSAANRACLVASSAAVVEICLFRDSSLNRTENRMSAIVVAMQKDLAVFIEPDIQKNRWNSK